LVDEAFIVVIFIPNYVLSSHVAVEIDARLKDIVIGVDLLSKMLFVLDSLVKKTLFLFELFVVLS